MKNKVGHPSPSLFIGSLLVPGMIFSKADDLRIISYF